MFWFTWLYVAAAALMVIFGAASYAADNNESKSSVPLRTILVGAAFWPVTVLIILGVAFGRFVGKKTSGKDA